MFFFSACENVEKAIESPTIVARVSNRIYCFLF